MSWDTPLFQARQLLGDADWQSLETDYSKNRLSPTANLDDSSLQPWKRCLAILKNNGARGLIIEKRYIDVDFRAENSYLYSQTLQEIPDSSHRLHFFSQTISQREMQAYIDEGRNSPLASIDYLGYVCCRPAPLPIVSRAMIKPPSDVTARTIQNEEVNLFGITLNVQAVPFMQQDQRVAVCAHVAIWSANYLWNLRNHGERRTIVDVVRATEIHPRLSSLGLTSYEALTAFANLGFRPAIIEDTDLSPIEAEDWNDDEDAVTELQEQSPSLRSLMNEYNAYVLPCLNSAVPVYVDSPKTKHAFIICGYQKAPIADSEEPVIEYLVHDDRRGPYIPVPEREYQDASEQHEPNAVDPTLWGDLILPLPTSVHLNFVEAEDTAFSEYRQIKEDEEIRSIAAGELWDAAIEPTLSLRTYFVESAQFKKDLDQRGMSQTFAAIYRRLRLPRFVHVVEFIADSRTKTEPRVVGEVLLDSTSGGTFPWVHSVRVGPFLRYRHSTGEVKFEHSQNATVCMTGSPGRRRTN